MKRKIQMFIMFCLAVALMTFGNACAKKQVKQQSVMKNPFLADSYFYNGEASKSKGEYKQAISNYNKAIEINPEHIKAYNSRGDLYKNLGQIDKACDDWKQACELGDCDKYNLSKSEGDCK